MSATEDDAAIQRFREAFERLRGDRYLSSIIGELGGGKALEAFYDNCKEGLDAALALVHVRGCICHSCNQLEPERSEHEQLEVHTDEACSRLREQLRERKKK